MSGLADSALFAGVADTAVRGTFILLAALAGTALMRQRSAAARHLVWLAALSALLLLPVARSFVPEWRVLPASPVVFAAPLVQAPAAPAAGLSVGLPGESAPAAEGRMAGGSAPAPARVPVDGAMLALLAWAAGAALLGLRLAYGLGRVWWIERRAVELTDDGWVRLTDGLARQLKLGRIVRLLREPGATVPMTWGVFHPVILLPREADGWDDERRRVVLAHELAHVRRWDAATQWIAHLALAVYWFNPLVWVAVRKLREEREHACDDAVLEIGTRPAEYADHLLNIVRSLGSSQGTATAALAMARRSQFEGRLLAILDGAVRRNGVSRAAGLATAAAAIACLLPLAALRPAEGAASPARESSTRTTATTTTERTETAGTGTPSPRAAAAEDAALRDGRAALADALAALFARGDTLALHRAGLAAERGSLDARRASLRAAAGNGDGAAAVLMRAMEEAPDPGMYADLVRASLNIQSPTDRRLVLARVLELPDLSADHVAAIIAATRTMRSDTDRRLVLVEALGHRACPPGVPAALVESLRSFESPTEQRLVFAAVLERPGLGTADVVALLRVVPVVRSDTERRLVLALVAERQRVEGAVRRAYLEAARSIGDDTEQALALSALLEPAPAGPGTPPPSAAPASRGSREPGRGERVWNSTNEYTADRDGRRRAVRILVRDAIVGDVQWDVRGFRTGGSLFIEERMDGRTRRLQASCDGVGNPVWSYAVDGRTQPFDGAARRWMESVIRTSSS